MDIIRPAILNGDVEELRRILDENPAFPLADLKFTCFLRTPLHVAAAHGCVEFASVIVNHDSELAMKVDSQGCTPLHLASSRHDSVDMVKLLLEANTDACMVPDKNGGTPLHLAAIRDEVEVMELLIHSRPEAIHRRLLNTNETILHLCVKHNKFRALKMLVDYLVTNRANPPANIQHPISVNSVDSAGNTILHLAAQMKPIKIFEVLIKSDSIGFDINIRNNDGLTALDMLDRKEMEDIGISCYDYHTTTGGEVPQLDGEIPDPQQDRQVPQQMPTVENEWLKERLNTIMIVAALIAGVAFQAVINPPGGVFQEDSKIDAVEDPVRFVYYLRNIYDHDDMSGGFQSYNSHIAPKKTKGGNNTTADDIFTYRANFVKDLLTAAANTESLARQVPPNRYHKLAPAIVLEDDWWKNITSNYNKSSMGGLSGFSPYLIRYAGTSILAYASPYWYSSYIVLNSVSLLVCGLTIVLVTFDAIKQRPSGSSATSIVGYLEVLLVTAVACTSFSYAIVVKHMGPPFFVLGTLKSQLVTLALQAICVPLASFLFLYFDTKYTKRFFHIDQSYSRVREITFLISKILVFCLVLREVWKNYQY